jgi:hypothetical protein
MSNSENKKDSFEISDLLPSIPRERQLGTEHPGIGEEERMRYREISKQLGYYRGQQSKLENLLKTITAKLMQEAKRLDIKSQAEQKVYAEAHDDRLEIISSLATCVQLVSILWSEVNLFQIDIDVWRTKEASNRYEQKSYN